MALNKIEQAIKEVCGDEKINIDFSHPDATLKSLKIDSLAAMNIIMKIEDKLAVRLDDEKLLSIKTLGDLIEAFNKKIQ